MAARQAINRPNFSSPILSEAIIHNGLVYASGKIGLDAKTGALGSDDVAEQTSVLLEAGSGLHKIIKCNIYLTNIADFEAINTIYIATMPNPKPARVCVTVAELGRGAKVEIDCVAIAERTM
ncbi:Endoribonuclease L-PSP/chorismate mutase-like protein [Fusarium avenaceum]|nr:Endoribonuclease L-PSP/chorismate mutase-like protein [Fusarium avenaceum]